MRVSTGEQTIENQLRRLEDVAGSAGRAVVKVYDETACCFGPMDLLRRVEARAACVAL